MYWYELGDEKRETVYCRGRYGLMADQCCLLVGTFFYPIVEQDPFFPRLSRVDLIGQR
jgi:hypothetical protein